MSAGTVNSSLKPPTDPAQGGLDLVLGAPDLPTSWPQHPPCTLKHQQEGEEMRGEEGGADAHLFSVTVLAATAARTCDSGGRRWRLWSSFWAAAAALPSPWEVTRKDPSGVNC